MVIDLLNRKKKVYIYSYIHFFINIKIFSTKKEFPYNIIISYYNFIKFKAFNNILEFKKLMAHSVKIYDTCIGCTQCVRACPTDVLEMVPWDGCKANQIASAPRTEDCVGCKRCESACPTDFLSIRVYLGAETTRSMGLSY